MSKITFDEIMDFYPEHNRSVYEDLKNDCCKQHLIPFVGAGLSVFCGYDTWPSVLKQLTKHVYGEEKQKDINAMIENGELLQAAQEVYDNLPRILIELKKIIDYKKISDCDAEKIHSSAAYLLPYLFKDSMVMTTNFDRVLEEIYSRHKAKFEKTVNPNEPDILTQLRQQNIHCLFKLHGDIGENTVTADSLVFTQKQYDSVYATEGPLVQELTEWFKNKKLLFLGCSMARDRTMDILRSVSSNNSTLDHYAILDCKPEDMECRIKEMGELGISAIYYPSGKYEAVRVILERILEEINYPAYEILKNEEKTHAPEPEHRFMYYSDFIEFTGREAEMESLEEFCQDSEQISWWAVTGPGGIGKSRLIHELAKRKQKQGWKIHWLNRAQYETLDDWLPGPDHSLVIADDVQAYLQIIGKWINSIADRPRSGKLRIILLERDGNDLNSASWGEALQEESPYSSPVISKCYRSDFLKLDPLSEDDLKTIMTNFAAASGKPFKKSDYADNLLKTLKKVDSGLHRPIYALAIADAWCSGKDPTCWDKKQVLDALVNRELDFYYKRLKNVSDKKITKTMESEFATLLARSCVSNFIRLDEISEQKYPKLTKCAENADMDLTELIRTIGVVSKVRVHVVEIDENGNETENKHDESFEAVILKCPDLIKEYLVLRQAFDHGCQELLLPENWDNDPGQLFFITRLLRDYPEKLDGKSQFWEAVFAGDPEEAFAAEIYSYFLFGIIVQLPKMTTRAVERMQAMHEKFNTSEEIAVLYSRSLVSISFDQSLEERVHTNGKLEKLYQQFNSSEEITESYAQGLVNLSFKQPPEECVHSVDKLKKLYQQFSSSEEIAEIYAQGLLNLSFNQPREELVHTFEKLEKLYKQFDSNEEIAKRYAQGLVNLSFDQPREERIHTFEKLEKLYQQFDSSEKIAEIYAKGLLNLSAEQPLEERVHSVDKLEKLYRQFSSSEEITELYAKGLFNLSVNQPFEECVHAIDKLKKLRREFEDNEELTVIYANGLTNLSLESTTEEDVREILKESKRLTALYPDNAEITLSYAMTYFNLTLKQSGDIFETTVAGLRKYLLAHKEINNNFQEALDKYFSEHPDHTERYKPLRI